MRRAKNAPMPTTIPYPTPLPRTWIPSDVAILGDCDAKEKNTLNRAEVGTEAIEKTVKETPLDLWKRVETWN